MRAGKNLYCSAEPSSDNVDRIMLNPARFRKVLGELMLCDPSDLAFVVEGHCP